MKLRILVDNNTITDRYFRGEPGLSILLEDGDARILLDAGYSDLFVGNARRMGLELLHLDWVVLSHGHLDHTWGLGALARLYTEAACEGLPHSRPVLTGHPEVFASKAAHGLPEIGALMGADKTRRQFELLLSSSPLQLSEHVVMLGEIPRIFDFENSSPLGQVQTRTGEMVSDSLVDDTALACSTAGGLVVVTGCAHAGVCNTVEYARKVTGIDRVVAVVGGTHLLEASDACLKATGEYLGGLELSALHACHCTDLAAKIALARTCPVRETGVGTALEFEPGTGLVLGE